MVINYELQVFLQHRLACLTALSQFDDELKRFVEPGLQVIFNSGSLINFVFELYLDISVWIVKYPNIFQTYQFLYAYFQ